MTTAVAAASASVPSRSPTGSSTGAFAARAEAIGLRYNVATRIEGYNYSQGRQVSIAVFRSEGTQ